MDAAYCQKHHNTVGVATCKLCVIDELKQQRDELLAALEECLSAYSASPKRPPDLVEDWEKCLARIDKANRQARAAIAKVKP